MLVPVKASALVASSPFLIVASSALSTGSFECPVPVIPSNLGPSNACCSQLIQLPATSILNPAGNGNLYWGVNCTNATVEQNIGDGSTQAITYPCPTGLLGGCCDPTVRHYFGGGPCTQTESPD